MTEKPTVVYTLSAPHTCEEYRCEGGYGHTHVGVQPHLRRVVGPDGKVVDGKTGEILEEGEKRK